MSSGNIRRAQLVSPFGVGALSILVDGTSVITAGLDAWYDVETKNQLRLSEYQAQDWRLQARLKVGEFRLPPDYRPGNEANARLTVPVLRFPGWSFCIYCKRLEHHPLTFAQPVYCDDPKHKQDIGRKKKRGPRMSQVPFVAICTLGHLDDFPFRQWVHRRHQPSCNGVLRLQSRGGGGLDGQVVICDEQGLPKGCGAERSLAGILIGATGRTGEERTNLTDQLAGKDDPFYCTGARPWLGEDGGSCDRPVRGALRAAGNIYFPKVESSLYLPQKIGAVSATLHELLIHPDVSPALRALHQALGARLTVEILRGALPVELFKPITDEELMAGYRDHFGIADPGDAPDGPPPGSGTGEDGDDDSLTRTDEWRHDEYRLLRETPDDPYLTAKDPGVAPELEGILNRVRRVDVLRETRAMRGFTRVRDSGLKLTAGKRMLRRGFLEPSHDWLPAYVVKGEGIYLELDRQRLKDWEQREAVLARAGQITQRFGDVARLRGLRERTISPRFVLLHTLGHLLINELIYACGYSSASLRERLYVSESPERSMAGILIYTAAGDSEGTMGGLVRMAKPGQLWPVMANALSDARWCSTDPVCMEAGEAGQGPDSCNLAACHGCALLPETSCEEFNRFLDRGLVVGTFTNPDLGYFSDLASNTLQIATV
ncbi:DUF1998 domain-containing protein [Pseudofrankia inefficax]|uniref:MrfA-like Zn-binding domain-containing protein n=1 Tax=Pseudofrankia inefficax (strain DSM 45817 / CECT 9037 / DDB 130130 / EuI1c) TaxID=298654 RepID=E3IVZ8_PSEI1|nr:DUF1998 domain-containing protein [Pseudofrankia inefficax]ADP84926.1 Protein of unknown function DUF1998 [Pseudofrankia inefficax]